MKLFLIIILYKIDFNTKLDFPRFILSIYSYIFEYLFCFFKAIYSFSLFNLIKEMQFDLFCIWNYILITLSINIYCLNVYNIGMMIYQVYIPFISWNCNHFHKNSNNWNNLIWNSIQFFLIIQILFSLILYFCNISFNLRGFMEYIYPLHFKWTNSNSSLWKYYQNIH